MLHQHLRQYFDTIDHRVKAGIALVAIAATGAAFMYSSPTHALIADGANAVDMLGQYDGSSFSTPVPAYTKNFGGNDVPNRYGTSTPGDGAFDLVHHRYFQTDKDNGRVLVYNLNIDNTFPDRIPDNVLGKPNFWTRDDFVSTATNIVDPMGLAYDSAGDRLFVSTNGSNRVLVFDTAAITDGEAAVYVIGQADMTSSGSATTQAGISVPQNMVYDAARNLLFVANNGNHRVTVYDVRAEGSGNRTLCGTITTGIATGMNASCVLGQATFIASVNGITQAGMSSPSGVALDSATGRLFVAEEGGRRVKVWDVRDEGSGAQSLCGEVATTGIATGMNASCVLGQTLFTTNTLASPPTQASLRSPRGLDFHANKLYVADNGDKRVLVFDVAAITNGENAVNVLGQIDFITRVSRLDQGSTDFPWFARVNTATNRLHVGQANGAYRVSIFDIAAIVDNENAVDMLNQEDGTSPTDPQPTYTFGNQDNAPNAFGMDRPTSVFMDTVNHRLFVSDNLNSRVLVYNLDNNNLLQDRVADVVLGQANFKGWNSGVTQVGMNRANYFAYDYARNYLFVSDQNRVLVYDAATLTNGEAAIFVLGQANFTANAVTVDASTLSAPQGIAYDAVRGYLFVADSNRHRVLVFDVNTITDGEPAIKVLGQGLFTTNASGLTATTLNLPWDIAFDSANNRLFVADFTNNRTLQYDVAVIDDGEAAVHVLGQDNMTSNTAALTQAGQRSPTGLAYDNRLNRLFVGQDFASHNRVLVYDTTAIVDGENAINVLGQPNFTSGGAAVTQAGISSADGLEFDSTNNRLYVADMDADRVMVFDAGGAGFLVTQSGGTTAVTEGGATDSFTVVLTAQPASDVVIDVSSNDVSSATVSAATLTFTNGNWSTPQTLIVTAPEDPDAVSETPTITLSVNDAGSDNNWDPLADQTVNTTVTDNDSVSFDVTITAGANYVVEEGATDSFTLVLGAQPASNVVLNVSSSDTTQATVSPAVVTFTTANWNVAQTVTITAPNDTNATSATVTITIAVDDALSDNAFDGLADVTMSATIVDNEAPVSQGSGGGFSAPVGETSTISSSEDGLRSSAPEEPTNDNQNCSGTGCVVDETGSGSGMGQGSSGGSSGGGVSIPMIAFETHWAKEYIQAIEDHCDMTGYLSRNLQTLSEFQPDGAISRAELVKLLVSCRQYDITAPFEAQFRDVEEGEWYTPYIQAARLVGIVEGYPDGTFRPDAPVTREEAMKIILLSRFEHETIGAMPDGMTDVNQKEWYAKYVNFGLTRGFVNGYLDSNGNSLHLFGIGKSITRAEAAKVIVNVLGL